MGTSVSQRSATTASWRAVWATYRSDVPLERVATEVWRAALHDTDASWEAELNGRLVERVRAMAGDEGDPGSVAQKAFRATLDEPGSALIGEVARLAVAGSVGRPNADAQFVRRVFELSTEYLVARDLAGFIGTRYRNRTIREGLEFRKSVGRIAGERAAAAHSAAPHEPLGSLARRIRNGGQT